MHRISEMTLDSLIAMNGRVSLDRLVQQVRRKVFGGTTPRTAGMFRNISDRLTELIQEGLVEEVSPQVYRVTQAGRNARA